MSSITLAPERRTILRHSSWDALLVALAAVQGPVVVWIPSAPVIALALWWNSNTIAHNFIHRPFFCSRLLNRLFSVYLTVLLGAPQTLWRDRHLAHHAGIVWRPRYSTALLVDVGLVVILWASLLFAYPVFFLTAYVPGYIAGLALCYVHGHYEHVRGTISHYGRLYNLLFFNDGYHVEHHAHPGAHWTSLPQQAAAHASTSRWPAVLRWLDGLSLEGLERRVLRSPQLQRFVLSCHEKAFRRLLANLAVVHRVGIVGGALFPRTALVCRQALPQARLTIIDANADNIGTARVMFPPGVEVINEWFDPARHDDFDLLVIPLSFVGDRSSLYRQPPASVVLIHDWVWRSHRPGVIISWLLLKRLNLVMR
jgi:hypothetical protein